MSLNILNKFSRVKNRGNSFGRTDTGLKRRRNEDSFCIMPNRNIYIVADGMGGHKAGDIASKTAIDILAQYYIEEKLETMAKQEAIRHTMIAGFIKTNEKIMAMSAQDRQLQGMGCTMIACLVVAGMIHLCHVGDVRGYIVESGRLRQLTNDHSHAAEFDHRSPNNDVIQGKPPKNILSRAIGFPFSEDPEYNFSKLHAGDRVILCSDGLWGMVDDYRIKEVLLASSSPETACETLIAAANEAGGKDNITVVAVFMA